MISIDSFVDLMTYDDVNKWNQQVYRLGSELGYEQTLLAIFPDKNAPIEAEFAFLHSNYSSHWRSKYDEEKMGHVDPTVMHCATKSTPLIWTPNLFSERKQKEMYEEACSHGIRSGVTLPIHGASGEFGILCFVADRQPNQHFDREVVRNIPALSCFRDYIFESSLQFMKSSPETETKIKLTPRELECLKWSATGKSSWDIAQILNCSQAAVNFHFMNIRRKFGTNSRHHAVVKALRTGLINSI